MNHEYVCDRRFCFFWGGLFIFFLNLLSFLPRTPVKAGMDESNQEVVISELQLLQDNL